MSASDEAASSTPAPPPPSSPAGGRRIALNTIVNGTSIVLSVGMTIPLTPFLIDRLGAGAYGIWVLGLSFTSIGGYLGIGELGFQGATIRYVARSEAQGDWEQIRKTVNTTLTIFLALGGVAALALFLFAQFGVTRVFNIPADLESSARLVFSLLAVQVLAEYSALALTGYLEGLQRFPTIAALRLGQLAVFIVLAVVLVVGGAGVEGVAAASAIAATAHAAASLATIRVQPGSLPVGVGVDRATLPELTHYSWKLLVIRTTNVLYDQMDKTIIGIALSPVSLTLYDIANKIHLGPRLALTLGSSALTPAASSLHASGNTDALRALMLRATRVTMAITLPIGFTAMVLAKPLIDVWVGSEFDDAAPVARLFIVYVLFTAIITAGSTMLTGMGIMNRLVVFGVISVLINLAVSIALVGPLGIKGVVVGTTIGYLITFGPTLALILERFHLSLSRFLREGLGRPFVLALGHASLLALATVVHPPDGAVQTLGYAAVGLAAYAVAYVAVAADPPDRAALRRLLARRSQTV
jgi:O-antigen/teichoic acid export membrane protein